MRIILLSFFVLCCISAIGQTKTIEISIMERLNVVEAKLTEFDKKLHKISVASNKNRGDIQNLKQLNDTLYKSFDSLKDACDSLKNTQEVDRASMNDKIQNTNNIVVHNQSVLRNRSLWGSLIIILIFFLSGGIFLYLFKRIKSDASSIDEVRKAQDALQNAQTKMQEESIKLDNKLLEIAEQQMKKTAAIDNQATTTVDHSLALKVGDEIVRIELNLSRMDSSIKGYKQLAKAVQRIKDNFQANGYEIIDMLGKPYNEGMKVIANFVSDETLEQGKQVITGIIKPQINYNGKMIQSAQITVSQNI